MIERYQIKNVDDEEVLYIYLNYSYEFGNFENNFFTNLKDNIKKYLAKLKVKFNGNKIMLIVGGILVASIYLSPIDKVEINKLNIEYTSSSIVEKITNTNEINNNKGTLEYEIINEIVNNQVQSEENIKIDNQISTSNNTSNEQTSNQNTVTNNNEQINNSMVSNNNIKEEQINNNVAIEIENNNQSNSNIQNNEVTSKPVIEQTQEMVTIYRSNGTILELPFEEYIVGVVAAEMPASFPIEALKAQAVVARTYARARLQNGLTLTDTVSTQVYKDNSELQTMWGNSYNYYYSKVKEAVSSTENQAIYYNGKYIDAVYHSTSNGNTEDAKYVWGNSIPYLKSVSSPWDTYATTYLRTEEKSEHVLFSTLGLKITEDTTIEILSRNESGRILEVKLGENIYDGVTLRNILGLRSADFDLEVNNGNLVVTTRGYGHGVGMSQYGASGMAKEGYSYIQILKHYYTGVSIY